MWLLYVGMAGHKPSKSSQVVCPVAPSMESFFMQTRKQEDSCGRGVPALNSVGEACVNHRCDSRWYVSTAADQDGRARGGGGMLALG